MNDDLEGLIADLSQAPIRAARNVVRELNAAGRDVRDDARKFAPGAHGGPAKHYPASITSEDLGGFVVEVGPETGGQGSLGHLFEHGIESRGLPPHAHLGPALDRRTPGLVARLEDAMKRSLW